MCGGDLNFIPLSMCMTAFGFNATSTVYIYFIKDCRLVEFFFLIMVEITGDILLLVRKL